MKKTTTKILRVRLTAHEWRKLEAFAMRQGRTKSGVVHEYLRRLPNPELLTQLADSPSPATECEVATGEESTPLPAQ